MSDGIHDAWGTSLKAKKYFKAEIELKDNEEFKLIDNLLTKVNSFYKEIISIQNDLTKLKNSYIKKHIDNEL